MIFVIIKQHVSITLTIRSSLHMQFILVCFTRNVHVVKVYYCSQIGTGLVHHNVYNLALDFPRIKPMRTFPKASLSLIIRIFQSCNLLTILRSLFSQSFQLDFLGPRRSQAQQQCIPTFFASLPPIDSLSLLARPVQVQTCSSPRTAHSVGCRGNACRRRCTFHSGHSNSAHRLHEKTKDNVCNKAMPFDIPLWNLVQWCLLMATEPKKRTVFY